MSAAHKVHTLELGLVQNLAKKLVEQFKYKSYFIEGVKMRREKNKRGRENEDKERKKKNKKIKSIRTRKEKKEKEMRETTKRDKKIFEREKKKWRRENEI